MPLLYKEHPLLEKCENCKKKKNPQGKYDGQKQPEKDWRVRGGAMQTDHSNGSPDPAGMMRWALLVLRVIFIGKWRCGVRMEMIAKRVGKQEMRTWWRWSVVKGRFHFLLSIISIFLWVIHFWRCEWMPVFRMYKLNCLMTLMCSLWAE